MKYIILDSNSTVIYITDTEPVKSDNCITCGGYKFIQPDLKIIEIENIPDGVHTQGYTYNEETGEFTERPLLLSDYATKAEVDVLEAQVADLMYKQISISSFTHNKGNLERGTEVTSVTLKWTTNKTPKTLSLDGETLSPTLTTVTKSYTDNPISYTNNKTWKLEATDERNAKVSKTTSIAFLNKIYYGVSKKPSVYDSAFVLGLANKTLTSKKVSPITVSAGEEEYIYYCIPKDLGECTFAVGPVAGGFPLVTTIQFTNTLGFTEDYYIYESINPNLGELTITIS